jgi:predicted nucleic acid-binding protein
MFSFAANRLRVRFCRARLPDPLVSDAELAALTIECGGVLHTADRDFARFPA